MRRLLEIDHKGWVSKMSTASDIPRQVIIDCHRSPNAWLRRQHCLVNCEQLDGVLR